MPLTTEQRDKSIREIRDASIQAAGSAAVTAAPRVIPAIRDRVQQVRANQNSASPQTLTNNLRSLEGRTQVPHTSSSQPVLPSVDEMREAARQRAFDRTERSAAETYRNYVNNGGLEGQRARDLAQAQARAASDRAQILEAQRYEREVLQPRFAEESKRVAEKVAREQIIESQRQAAARIQAQNNARLQAEAIQTELLRRQEFERALAERGRSFNPDAKKHQAEIKDLFNQSKEANLARQKAAIDAELLYKARLARDAELAETAIRTNAAKDFTNRLEFLNRNVTRFETEQLLRNGSYVNEFNRLQQQQLTRMTARALNYPVDALEAAEVARLRRPTTLDLLPDNRPPINSEALRSRVSRSGIEGVSKEPFTNRPKPTYPTKPPTQERAPRLPDTFHPIELKAKERVKFNPLDLRPIPPDLQNGLTNKTKSLLPHRPLPSNLNPALPKPWFPGFPKTNFPIRMPKGTKGNVIGDLVFDLVFPDPLNNGEDEMLKKIANQKALEASGNTHRNRYGEREPFDYSNPNKRGLPNWNLDDLNRNSTQIITFDFAVVAEWDDKRNIYQRGDGFGGWKVDTLYSAGGVHQVTIRSVSEGADEVYKWFLGSDTPSNSSLMADGSTWHQKLTKPKMIIEINGGESVWNFDGSLTFRPYPGASATAIPNTSTPISINPNAEPILLPPEGVDPGFNPAPNFPLKFRPSSNPRKPQWRPEPKGTTPLPPWKDWDDPSRPESMEPDPVPGSGINRQPLPTFQIFEKPKPRTQTEEQHEKECEGGGDCMTCRFSIAAIRAVVQEEINKQLESNTTVEIYDDDTGKIEKKPMKVLSLKTTSDAVKTIYSEIAKVREQKPVATVPDRFKTRVPDDRPQMIVVYADAKNKSHYQLVIPWARNAKPVASKWKKGSKMVILELRDNSKIVVNAINEAEGNRVINQLKASISADKLRDSKITTSCRKDKLKEIDVTPIRADWYERGLAQDTPTKRYYYA